MKERPILFSGAMVRSILEGRKTQTRRVIKDVSTDVNHWSDFGDGQWNPMFSVDWMTKEKLKEPVGKAWCHKCPYGQPGDRLWVREKFQPIWDNEFDADWNTGKGYAISYPATDGIQEYNDMRNDERLTTACKPSIHMPRWASRITLEVVSIRVERLQDISEEDARAEGCPGDCYFGKTGVLTPTCKDWFIMLWESINAGRGYSWDSNPWVWVVEFRKLEEK